MKFVRALWWAVFLVSLVILVGSLPGYWAQANDSQLPAEYSALQIAATWTGLLLSIGGAWLCISLALLLFLKKRADRMAFFLSFYLLIFGIFLVGPVEMFLPFWFPASGNLALNLETAIFPIPTLILFFTFPNGQFVPRWTRWLALAGSLLILFLFTQVPLDSFAHTNFQAEQLVYSLFGVLLLFAFGTQFYRYRKVSTPTERQQTKWVLYGFLVSYLLLIVVSIPYYYVENLPPGTPPPWWFPLSGAGWWLALSIQPLAFTIAILRARLWDIDILVRRTVLYGLVTLTLALIYFASVIILQRVFSLLTGGAQNDIVTVLSTLGIAALFVPLRNRIQHEIDKRFNRSKYDAQQILNEFAKTMRDETDLEMLTGRLMQVVNETMQPRSVSMWLKTSNDRRGEPRL